jgi:Ankyrin repeats (many copies)
MISRRVPEARNVLCDCLKSVFRKDEESAWTIVASRAHSSSYTYESGISDAKDDDESIYSTRHFTFTNDLLTAPVYRRLALHELSRPNSTRDPNAASSCNAPGHTSQLSVHARPSSTFRFPDITAPSREMESPTRSNKSYATYDDPRLVEVLDQAADGSSAVSDFEWLRSHPSGFRPQRYLPIRASLKREEMTIRDRERLDLKLINATRSGYLYEITVLLDNGADINAASPHNCQTILQIALMTHQSDSVVFFLLLFKTSISTFEMPGEGLYYTML